MNYGMQIAASGVLTSMYRQDVMANNLANVDTAGFKNDIAAARARPAARTEDGLFNLPSNAMLERLGAGPLMAPNRLSTSQGSMEPTGRPLDMAIEGEGFFVVMKQDGAGGGDQLRLSRDGRMTLDASGRLVQATSGLPVLDVADRPIVLPGSGPISVDSTGRIRQNGEIVAQVQVASVPDPSELAKDGSSLMRASAAALTSRKQGGGLVNQYMIERSNVDPINAVMGVNNASNAVGSNARMISMFDELLGRAVNTFARLA